MAIATKSTGTRVQTWLPISLAEQLRTQGRSRAAILSGLLRVALEDRLRGAQEKRP